MLFYPEISGQDANLNNILLENDLFACETPLKKSRLRRATLQTHPKYDLFSGPSTRAVGAKILGPRTPPPIRAEGPYPCQKPNITLQLPLKARFELNNVVL